MLQKLFRYPWIIIVLVLAGTLFFGLQLPKIRIDNDITRFIPELSVIFNSGKRRCKLTNIE